MAQLKNLVASHEVLRSHRKLNFCSITPPQAAGNALVNPKVFNEMTEKNDKEMALLKNTLNGLQQEMTPYKNYVKHTLPMLENLVEYYRKADGKTKNKILSCIFAEKLIIEKGRVATAPFTPQVQVLLNIVKGFQRSKKKQEVDFDLLSMIAPPPGLEPGAL